jgi:hypothetical protein
LVQQSTKQRILFLVHTEYHVMVALSLIADKFSSISDYQVDIIQTQTKKKNRFQFDLNTNIASNVSYNVMYYEELDFNYNSALVQMLQQIFNTHYAVFVLFNHHAYLPAYMAKILYKKGTEIHLAPDGMKVYNTNRKITPRWSLKAAFEFQKFSRANQFEFQWHVPKLGYANLKEIKKLYIDFPQAYDNYTHKIIEEFNVLHSPLAKKMVSNYFNFKITDDLERTDKVIMYINQATRNEPLYDFEIEVLQFLALNYPNYQLVVKLHPSTEPKQFEKMKRISGIQFISKSYPAELYIAQLVNSMVVSFFSTACLINNENSRIYWLTNIIKERNIMLDFVSIQNPTSHILEVKDLNEIK